MKMFTYIARIVPPRRPLVRTKPVNSDSICLAHDLTHARAEATRLATQYSYERFGACCTITIHQLKELAS